MVGEHVLHLRTAIVGVGISLPCHHDPLLAIGDVDDRAHGSGATRRSPVVALEHAIDVRRRLDGAALPAHQLFHSFTVGGIEVLGVDGRLCRTRLCPERLHPVGVVPLEVAGVRLLDEVAGAVVAIVDAGLANRERGEAIGARCDTEYPHCAAGAVVRQPDHAAGHVVAVRLAVQRRHAGCIVLVRGAMAATAEPTAGTVYPRRSGGSAAALTAGCRDQSIERVVRESADQRVAGCEGGPQGGVVGPACVRVDPHAAAGCAVRDAGDVACQIVLVGEVLEDEPGGAARQLVRGLEAFRSQPYQGEGLGVVGIARHQPVAVRDERSLPLGVVGDSPDDLLAVEGDPLQRARRVVAEADLPSPAVRPRRGDHRRRAAEGVEATRRLVDRPVEQLSSKFVECSARGGFPVDAVRRDVPVRCCLAAGREDSDQPIVGDDLSALAHRVALEVAAIDDDEPGFVEVAMDGAEAVGTTRRGASGSWLVGNPSVAVLDPLAQRHRVRSTVTRPLPVEPSEPIEAPQCQGALAVAVLDLTTKGIEDRPIHSGVDAVDAQHPALEVVDVRAGTATQRVDSRDDIAADVIFHLRLQFLDRRERLVWARSSVPIPRRGRDRPSESVEQRARRGVPVVLVRRRFERVGAPGVVVGVERVGLPWRRRESVWIVERRWNAVDHSLLGTVGTGDPHEPSPGVVGQHGALTELSLTRRREGPARGEKRFVPGDDVALVVVALPAADHDVGRVRLVIGTTDDIMAGRRVVVLRRHGAAAERGIAEDHVFGARPDLDEPAEPVGELDNLDRVVGFGGGHVTVVDVMGPAGGPHRHRCRREVVGERGTRDADGVADALAVLAHYGNAFEHAEGRVRVHRPVGVGVGRATWLQHAVVVLCLDRQPGGIGAPHRQQAELVVVDRRIAPERVALGDEESPALCVDAAARRLGKETPWAAVTARRERVPGEWRERSSEGLGVVGRPLRVAGAREVRWLGVIAVAAVRLVQ